MVFVDEVASTQEVILWDTLSTVFDIFSTSRLYMLNETALDTRILLALIRENSLPLNQTLLDIYDIFTAYLQRKLAYAQSRD